MDSTTATHAVLPISSGGSGTAAGMGLGGLAVGGIGGLILGSLINGNGGILGNGNGSSGTSALEYGELMEAISDAKLAGVTAAAGNQAQILNGNTALSTAIANSNLSTLQSVNSLGASLQQPATQNLITNLQSFNSRKPPRRLVSIPPTWACNRASMPWALRQPKQPTTSRLRSMRSLQ